MKLLRTGLSLALLCGLTACADSGIGELQAWMDQVRKEARVVVPKIVEPKKFTPFVYSGSQAVDPFDPQKLAVALARQKASPNAFKPNLERRRDPLEAYPLDTLKMVGTLQKAGVTHALILADRTLFHVKAGNYIGQNFGIITGIGESQVELKEIVQDAAGDWVERDAKLELQESKK